LKTPHISIIIPTHNSENTIEQCIDSLNNQSYPRENFEIIIVDDGSKDDSINLSKKAGVDNIIITEPCFQGKARNIGVNNSNANLIAFIDSDCKAKDDWIKSIIDELKNFHAVTGPIKNGNPQSRIAWAEHFLNFGGYNEFRKKSPIRFLPGCNQAFRKKTFQIVGGFTESHSSEDVIFGESLKKNRIKAFFVPKIQISHLGKTNLSNSLSHMRLIGKYSSRARLKVSSLPYTLLFTKRYFIPIIFIGKLVTSTLYAFHARKLSKMFFSFPYVILGISSFCQGIFEELNQNSKRLGDFSLDK